MVGVLHDAPEAALWPEREIRESLQEGVIHGFVVEAGKEVLAFVAARVVMDEAEILNLAVRRSERRKGLGKRLIERTIESLKARGATKVFLEVRESNEAGRAFYKDLGFRTVGRRKGYYQGPPEDALVMERELGY